MFRVSGSDNCHAERSRSIGTLCPLGTLGTFQRYNNNLIIFMFLCTKVINTFYIFADNFKIIL